MEAPLSSYWVKFFKNAGFPTDVATRYAVIFSNNRIKPDMLPDLDKPCLKEMGITLMGDMIAILRYAKNVVEETTCKNLLVSEDTPPKPTVKPIVKPIIKKVITKTGTKTIARPVTAKVKLESTTKVIKSSSVKPSLTLKKKVINTPSQNSRMYSDYMDSQPKPKVTTLKRKYSSEDEGIDGKWVHNESEKRRKSSEDVMNYKIVVQKPTPLRSQKIIKKSVEQKKTVFHRLGDSLVSSTTGVSETFPSNSSYNPTFTVTGVSKDNKRNSSVFNRLGSKEHDQVDSLYNRGIRNGSGSSGSQGILKSRVPLQGTKVLTTKPVLKKPVGTMRADEEATIKSLPSGVRQMIRPMQNLKFNDRPSTFKRKLPVVGKLASERMEVPAKNRLGVNKQVTFNRTPSVNHFKKPGVFSRLGV